MKPFHALSLAVLAAGLWFVTEQQTVAQSDQEAINVARSVIKADRQAVVAEALQFTPAESEKFWPLYHQYRAEMDKVGDGMVRLVQEYAALYPDIPEDRAKRMLKDLLALEKKQVSTRAKYLKKVGKVLPADKNLRFAQVEARLDLALRLRLASEIPLVPIEGRMTGESVGGATYVAGVPGGVVVRTLEIKATVAAIDRADRRLTLVSPEGIKKTVKAGPEVVNFDQIRVGDQVKVRASEELVVALASPGESAGDGSDALVALAPKGAKPGGIMAETRQSTAVVTAIDLSKHTATLRFADGSTETFPVRNDVDLSKRKIGEQVVFRFTEMTAIAVSKP